GTLPPEKLKNASGLYNLMRNLGGAIGLAAINTVLTQRLAHHWQHLASRFSMTDPQIAAYLDQLSKRFETLIPGDPDVAAHRLVGNILQREAYVLTFNDVLMLMALIFAVGLLVMPLVRKPGHATAEAH